MTGKELIIYILEHNLENNELPYIFATFLTAEELAVDLEVGVSTIKAWYDLGLIKGCEIEGTLYFPVDTKDPRTEAKVNGTST